MILSLYHEYRPDATKNKDAWKNMRLYLSKFDGNMHHLHNNNGFSGFKITVYGQLHIRRQVENTGNDNSPVSKTEHIRPRQATFHKRSCRFLHHTYNKHTQCNR